MASGVSLYGYHLTFDAEMTTPADGSQFQNTYANGDRYIYGNYEAEYYADNNPASPSDPFSFANGALTITASPTPVGNQPYTSGIIQTANTFSQNTGYFEIRATVPTGAGFWPAFWLLTKDYSTEIDILEEPNLDGPTNYFTSIKTSDLRNNGGFNDIGVDVSSGYHTYGLMWTPYTIQFTFDGQYIGYGIGTPAGLANAKTYLIANLGVGGPYSWPGVPVTGASAQFKIDYIRAFSSDPTVPGVAQEPISSPDGVDTTPVLLPSLPILGAGPNALVFQINEDAYLGDALFTISVDGIQQGGTMTASASRAFQQTQSLTINGNFGPGRHTVSVNFLNDKYDPGVGDRNLFVTQATLDGYVLGGSTLSLYSGGATSLAFSGATTFPPTVVLGSGPDVLSLQIAEDAYQGDAQFTISVDGKQVGGTQTATAHKTGGSTQAVDVLGNFGTGAHTATVNFLNDAYGGSTTTDRNLYVTQASVNNTAIPGSSLQEFGSGPQSFSFKASSPVNRTPNGGTASPTLLTLHLAEDAYQGDAQFIVSVDGTQLGAVQSVSALQSQGAAQAFSFADVLNAGTHDVAVSFINDLYGGNAMTDRNLYVVGADLNATAQNSTAWTASLLANGSVHFNLVVPS